jgi:transposase, IS5 family
LTSERHEETRRIRISSPNNFDCLRARRNSGAPAVPSEGNETIKEGETPEDWKSKPAKNRQKDKDARWTKKHERSYFGYKNHIGVDRRPKFVRRYVVSDASVHDSQKFEVVLDTSNTASDVWAAGLLPSPLPGDRRALR